MPSSGPVTVHEILVLVNSVWVVARQKAIHSPWLLSRVMRHRTWIRLKCSICLSTTSLVDVGMEVSLRKVSQERKCQRHFQSGHFRVGSCDGSRAS